MSASDLTANLSPQAKSLYEGIERFEIIDCHEHLGPEKGRVETRVDVFTLFQHYTRGDLRVAGMSEDEYNTVLDRDIPLAHRWNVFEPYWERIRWASYARAALITAKKFYGAEDINRDTYQDISEKIQKSNTPGIYERVLGEACNIRTSLTQCASTKLDSPRLTPVMPLSFEMEDWEAVRAPAAYDPNARVGTLDDLLDAMRAYVLRVKEEGAVGLKMISNPYEAPDREAAQGAFAELRDGKTERLEPSNPLRDYVIDETIRFAAKQELVICVHTGYWGDFRMLDPTHMIPILLRHPNARFDIYHLGYPYVRDALMLGKGFANVWLNLCWTHIISQRFAMAGLDEALDLIPSNKLLAFGGDYGVPVEKVYGHLVMAREDVARVLAERIAEGQMTEAQALKLAKMWFYDNPRELYRLNV